MAVISCDSSSREDGDEQLNKRCDLSFKIVKYLSEVGVKELPNIFDKLSWVLKWQPLRWAGPYYEVLRGPEVSSLCIASLQRFGKSPIISILTLMIFFFCLVIATD